MKTRELYHIVDACGRFEQGFIAPGDSMCQNELDNCLDELDVDIVVTEKDNNVLSVTIGRTCFVLKKDNYGHYTCTSVKARYYENNEIKTLDIDWR